MNIVGYINAELGIGEGARANIKCLQSAGIEVSLINITSYSNHRELDYSFKEFADNNFSDINLIHVNADTIPMLYVEKGRNFFKNKYNIGYWTWELSDFPDEWLQSFNYCDEIWVPSSFVIASIAKKSPIPVLEIPIAISVNKLKDVKRSHFGLKNTDFIFLFIFDFLSYFERKNPRGIVKAFKRAFLSSENVRLVIKCCNSSFDPQAMDSLKDAAQDLNIDIIEARTD